MLAISKRILGVVFQAILNLVFRISFMESFSFLFLLCYCPLWPRGFSIKLGFSCSILYTHICTFPNFVLTKTRWLQCQNLNFMFMISLSKEFSWIHLSKGNNLWYLYYTREKKFKILLFFVRELIQLLLFNFSFFPFFFPLVESLIGLEFTLSWDCGVKHKTSKYCSCVTPEASSVILSVSHKTTPLGFLFLENSSSGTICGGINKVSGDSTSVATETWFSTVLNGLLGTFNGLLPTIAVSFVLWITTDGSISFCRAPTSFTVLTFFETGSCFFSVPVKNHHI